MSPLLERRHVLVTGAAQDLGLGIARHLASQGAKVFLSDCHPSVTDRAAEPMFGTQALVAVVDLADAVRCFASSIGPYKSSVS
jgi:NAD(P)-dependent dehydrogenase (short-subunit alcohol dehydrogenase family)